MSQSTEVSEQTTTGRTTIKRVLRVDSSAQQAGSVTRAIGDEVIRRIAQRDPDLEVVAMDLADGMPHIDDAWIGASYTPVEQRSAVQRQQLAASDEVVVALQEADTVVLTVPVYNFAVPSVLKAWIDHVCRPGLTFRYTEKGPQGLLDNKPVYLVMASGGVPFGSPVDFASGYLKQVLRFIGIEDVRLLGAEGVAGDAEAAHRKALKALDEWLPGRLDQVA